VVAVIKKSKYLSEMSIDELQDSLATYVWTSFEFKEVCSSHRRCIVLLVEHDDQGRNLKQKMSIINMVKVAKVKVEEIIDLINDNDKIEKQIIEVEEI